MKYLIATDVHGSASWANKIKDAFFAENADFLVLLGDLYYHGPRNGFPVDYDPMGVADCFNSIAEKIVAVKGNCDSEVDQMISNFTFVDHDFVMMEGRKLFFTHGHVYNKDNLPKGMFTGDVLFHGHFHVSGIVDRDGVFVVSVGSASFPKDGLHPYAVVYESGVTIKDFESGKVVRELKFEEDNQRG